jgi:hypothetical protein
MDGNGAWKQAAQAPPWPLLLLVRDKIMRGYCLRRRRHLLRCVGRLFSSPASCRRIRTAAALDSALQIAGEGEVAAIELGC